MKAFVIVVVLLVAGVVGVGFYRGWFLFESESSDGKSNITLSVDGDKFQEDRKSATESVQGAGKSTKE